MQPLTKGRYQARLARTGAEVALAQQLRYLAFYQSRGMRQPGGLDCDDFDASSYHMLIEDMDANALVGCYRVQQFRGEAVESSYSAQFYDLSRLSQFPGALLELGRFCLHPNHHDPDILRLGWAAMARLVDAWGVALLFGCSSFAGADPAPHAAALAALRQRPPPMSFRPGPRAPERVALAAFQPMGPGAALSAMPALLRSYLSIGAWVSDHAVIDRAMDTLHVLTGVEIAAIPPARARILREIAAEKMG